MEKIITIKITNKNINLSESNFPRKEFSVIIETLDNKKIEIPSSSKLTEKDLEPFKEEIKKATKIIIPEGITELGKFIFKGQKNLQEVFLPSTLKKIPVEAFFNCIKLKEAHIANGTEEILHGAFTNCINLEKLFLPESLKLVGAYAFSHCESLRMLFLSKNTKTIYYSAFEHCLNLEEIYIQKNVPITESVFRYCCESLKINRYE